MDGIGRTTWVIAEGDIPGESTGPARRPLHQRFDDLEDPEPIPCDTDDASVVRSEVPIVGSTAGWTPGRGRTRC